MPADIWIDSLPTVAKTNYLDGSKALFVQCDAQSTQLGQLKARIFVKSCAFCFGSDCDMAAFGDEKTCVDVDLVAQDCYGAVVIGSSDATSPLSPGLDSGPSLKLQSINCQRDIWLTRIHGVSIDCHVITSKPASQRSFPPSGSPWLANDLRVESLRSNYAKNARITLSGNKGECDCKALFGSASAGRSGLGGSTSGCRIVIDLGGTSAGDDIVAEERHGPALTESILLLSSATGKAPAAFTD